MLGRNGLEITYSAIKVISNVVSPIVGWTHDLSNSRCMIDRLSGGPGCGLWAVGEKHLGLAPGPSHVVDVDRLGESLAANLVKCWQLVGGDTGGSCDSIDLRLSGKGLCAVV